MSSVICTNKREEHPDDRERVDGKTAHWSLSVGWFKLKILKKGYMVETPLNSDS
jgi:phosphate-selective porin